MTNKFKAPYSHSYTRLIYTILWGMVWLYPVLIALTVAEKTDTAVLWSNVRHAWVSILPFFVLFLLHRLPIYILLMRHRIRTYLLSVVGLICVFGAYGYLQLDEPQIPKTIKERPIPPRPDGPRDMGPGMDAMPPDDTMVPQPRGKEDITPSYHEPHPSAPRPESDGIPKPLMLDLVIATLMLGFDMGIALLARYQVEQEKARKMEAVHLRHELNHLKSQVNPHFFMNMLNNIHGMVEMDPAVAQVMIMEMSKLMRYVLYEGAKSRTTLTNEVDFITSYIELMRKRYSGRKVQINLKLPDSQHESIQVPPLLFISIIENAFKHGISYQNPSFVDISLEVKDRMLELNCTNSVHRHSTKPKNTGGVGLINLRQRLQLLFGNNYTLSINEQDKDTYHATLAIPCEYESVAEADNKALTESEISAKKPRRD